MTGSARSWERRPSVPGETGKGERKPGAGRDAAAKVSLTMRRGPRSGTRYMLPAGPERFYPPVLTDLARRRSTSPAGSRSYSP